MSLKKAFIGIILVFLILGVSWSGCFEKRGEYSCKKDADCILGVRLDQCCAAPKAVHKDKLEKDPNIVLYEEGKDYSELLPEKCKNVHCAPLPAFKSVKAVCENNLCKIEWEQKPTPTATPTPADISVEPIEASEKKAAFLKTYEPVDSSFESGLEHYSLPLELTEIQNYEDVKGKLGFTESPLLEQNGFMVFEQGKQDDVVEFYEGLKNTEVPVFVTSDSLLHLYHIQFDETLKEIEEKEFYEDMSQLSEAMLTDSMAKFNSLEGDLKEAAKRNAAFFSVGLKLLKPEAEVPTEVKDTVDQEIELIEAHQGFEKSPTFNYKEDYSQYVPRGHYTRSEKLKKYFKAMMWYGRMSFLLKGCSTDCIVSEQEAKIQTLQALLIAGSIQNVSTNEKKVDEIWGRIYDVTSFYVGLADDLTPYEYMDAISKVFGGKAKPSELASEEKLLEIKGELAQMRNPKIFGGTGNITIIPPLTKEKLNKVLAKTKGMRLMGQRFIPDSYMFQNLVNMGYTGNNEPFTKAFSGVRYIRGYPRGLDVMAVFGSDRALEILEKEGDTEYEEAGETYEERVNKLRAEFNAVDEGGWNQNLYWSWLYSLKALLKDYGEKYPAFMQGNAWKDKQLNSALGSWAQLRHDTILYAKQSYTIVETSMPVEKEIVGYIEPVPEFYARLLALNEMTLKGLKERNVLSEQAEQRIKSLSSVLERVLELSKKELENKELSEEDYDFIKDFGENLEGAIAGLDAGEELEKGKETTIVADAHTCTPEKKVLEEGTGYLRTMVVAYKVPDGRILLGAGPVFSYYEFKWPMDDRLTDEKWKKMLEKGNQPQTPEWINSFYTG